MEIRGEFAVSEQMRRSVLDHLQEVLGPTDSHTLIVRRSLGMLLAETGRAQEALPMLEEVVHAREQNHEQDDPAHLVRALTAWGRGLLHANQLSSSAEVLLRARKLQSSLPEDGEQLAELAACLATIYLRQGDLERATGFANEFDVRADDLRWFEHARNALLVAEGWRAVDRGDRAEEVLRIAADRIPSDDPFATYWRGQVDAALHTSPGSGRGRTP
jgi:tetratricopeptide (TPR) repeat protein